MEILIVSNLLYIETAIVIPVNIATPAKIMIPFFLGGTLANSIFEERYYVIYLHAFLRTQSIKYQLVNLKSSSYNTLINC